MATLTRTDAKNKLSTLEMKTRGRSITETDYFQMRALCMELAEVADGLRESAEEAMRDAKRYRMLKALAESDYEYGGELDLIISHTDVSGWDSSIDRVIAESDEEEKR